MIKLRSEVLNDFVFDYLFPEKEVLTRIPNVNENAVIHRKIVILGDTGAGKTSLARELANVAITKYGSDNVNCVESPDFRRILLFGLDKRLVQFHFVDDYSLAKEDNLVVRGFLKIRNIWNRMYNVSNGLIVSVVGLHRFFSNAMKEFRSMSDAIFVRNTSMNPYDSSYIKRLLGDVAYNDLLVLETYRDVDHTYRNFTPFRLKCGVTGLIDVPLSHENPFSNVSERIGSHFDILRRTSQLVSLIGGV